MSDAPERIRFDEWEIVRCHSSLANTEWVRADIHEAEVARLRERIADLREYLAELEADDE